MAAFGWTKFRSHADFDRVVEAFFVNENNDLDSDAYAVNGRGGDDGIDIHIRRDGRLTIVQLKYFPEGFAGAWAKARRPQIMKSFKTALKHDPDEWWLVVPTTLTPGERRYIDGLLGKQSPKRRTPKVVVFDRTRLDILASKHPGLVTLYTRDELLHAAMVYGQEKALMFHQDDVVERVAALAAQADSLDPDWRPEIFTENGITGTRIVPKHLHAAERSPITVNLKVRFDKKQNDLLSKFERAMFYGTPDRLDLPASVVSSFTVEGPAAFARSDENVEISFMPSASKFVGLPFALVFYDTETTSTESASKDPTGGRLGERQPARRKRTATFTGKTTWASAGHAGVSVRATFYDAITLEFILPNDRGKVATMNVKMAFGGCDPANVVLAVDLLLRIDSKNTVGLELDGKQLGRLLGEEGQESVFGTFRDDALVHRDVAADLVYVQNETSQHFNYPGAVEPADRVYLRCLRLLLEGKCIVMPDVRELTQKLSGDGIPELATLLTEFPHSIAGGMSDYGLDVFGHDIELGPAKMYAPQVEVLDAEGHLAAIEAGTVAGRELTLRALDGYGFWIYLEDRFVEDPDGKVRPVSLGLPHIIDAPDVVRALEAAS